MKKAEYMTPQVITFFGMPAIGILSGIIMIAFQEIYPAIACFGIALLSGLPVIIWRKWVFMQIIIDEIGLKTFYKNHIFREMKWEEIADARVFGVAINLSKKDGSFNNMRETIKDKSIINVRLDSKQGQALIDNKDKISVPIKDFEKLPQRIKEKFQK